MPMEPRFAALRSRARASAQKAFREGRIQRLPCSMCNGQADEMHHDDYDRPLDITWLCRGCHVVWHTKFEAKPFAPCVEFHYTPRPLTQEERSAVSVAFRAVKEMREREVLAKK